MRSRDAAVNVRSAPTPSSGRRGIDGARIRAMFLHHAGRIPLEHTCIVVCVSAATDVLHNRPYSSARLVRKTAESAVSPPPDGREHGRLFRNPYRVRNAQSRTRKHKSRRVHGARECRTETSFRREKIPSENRGVRRMRALRLCRPPDAAPHPTQQEKPTRWAPPLNGRPACAFYRRLAASIFGCTSSRNSRWPLSKRPCSVRRQAR